MKVKELIAKLQKCDQDLPVVLDAPDEGWWHDEIDSVCQTKGALDYDGKDVGIVIIGI